MLATDNECNMLKCRDIASQVSDYLDGTQTLRERIAVSVHLLMCGECRAFVRHLRIAISYYRRLPPVQLTDSEATEIVQRAINSQNRHAE